MSRPTPMLALFIAAIVPACSAVKTQVHLEKADAALTRAADQGAADGAIYEYTLAQRFLEKAREEALNNEFGSSEDLARASVGFSDQAVIALEQAGRRLQIDETGLDQGRAGSDLVDQGGPVRDFVDLPEEQLLQSPDQLITDQEVEALFGRDAVEAMHNPDAEAAPRAPLSPRMSDPPADGTATPAPTETPPAPAPTEPAPTEPAPEETP
jgi:hypothetical protein